MGFRESKENTDFELMESENTVRESERRNYSLSDRPNQYGEYVVRCYVNGKRHKPGDYHTTNYDDACHTMWHMMSHQ